MPGEWIAEKAKGIFARHFGGDFAEVQPGIMQGRCPAESMHSKGGAATDARIFLGYGPNGEKPGCYCLHEKCKPRLYELNGNFRDEIFQKDPNRPASKRTNEGVAHEPRSREPWIPAYNEAKLRGVIRAQPAVDEGWFESRSPVDPRKVRPGEFLEYVFAPGDRVLVFANFFSQGDFLWEVGGRGGFRLGSQQGVKAVRSNLPTDGGKDGIWYLANPVDGKWHPNPRRAGKFSRRSEEGVTRWRHLVLESDDAPQELWLRFLAMAPLAIAAIYSSGGRSWHALVRVDQPDKPSFDAMLRNSIKRTLPMLGADPGAMTPVRLTRLPGCTRGGRLQRCIFIDPKANPNDIRPINQRQMARKITLSE
jgi:hypothetical protein